MAATKQDEVAGDGDGLDGGQRGIAGEKGDAWRALETMGQTNDLYHLSPSVWTIFYLVTLIKLKSIFENNALDVFVLEKTNNTLQKFYILVGLKLFTLYFNLNIYFIFLLFLFPSSLN